MQKPLAIFLMLAMTVVGFTAAPVSASAASDQPKVDFTLNGTLTDDMGTGNTLVNLNPAENVFTTETVGGTPKKVLSFGTTGGLKLDNIDKILSNSGTYTIEVTARLDKPTTYTKIIDFKNRTSDYGLYLQDQNAVIFFPQQSGTLINNTDYYRIGITRDNSTNTINIYINGKKQITINDTDGKGIISAANILNFFTDDTQVTDKNAGGAVSRITIYDYAFTDAQMANSSFNIAISNPSGAFADAYLGQSVSFSGTVTDANYAPGVQIYYTIDQMDPVKAYTFSGAPGAFSANIVIPTTLSVGSHTIKIYAKDADGVCQIVEKTINVFAPSSACDVTGATTPSDAVIGTSTITASVANAVDSTKIAITTSANSTSKLYSDAACTTEIADGNMPLAVGVNTAYLKVTAQDGTTKIYTITITRAAAATTATTTTANPKTGDSAFASGIALLVVCLSTVSVLGALKRKKSTDRK